MPSVAESSATKWSCQAASALIRVPENEGEHDRRRFLDAPILVLEGLLQEVAEPDIPEEKEAAAEVLPIISPSAVLGKGRVERRIGERHGEHMLGAILLEKVPDNGRDRPA